MTLPSQEIRVPEQHQFTDTKNEIVLCLVWMTRIKICVKNL